MAMVYVEQGEKMMPHFRGKCREGADFVTAFGGGDVAGMSDEAPGLTEVEDFAQTSEVQRDPGDV